MGEARRRKLAGTYHVDERWEKRRVELKVNDVVRTFEVAEDGKVYLIPIYGPNHPKRGQLAVNNRRRVHCPDHLTDAERTLLRRERAHG